MSRRACLGSGLSAGLAFAVPGVCGAGVISNPVCENGVGDGCAELAGDSELLKSLQATSAARREQRAREALERYNINNFGDYFSASNPPKALVRHSDGTFEALTKDVVDAGLRDGSIKYGGSAGGVSDQSTSRVPFVFAE